MTYCYMCEHEINESNHTEEHIILNALGGRLTSKDLICKDCNSLFGGDMDAKLAKQFDFLSTYLMIERDRGDPQPITMHHSKTKEKFVIDHTGKIQMKIPKKECIENGDKVEINIQARDIKQAKQMLQGLKRTYKNLDVESVLSTAEQQEEFLDSKLQIDLSFGGESLMAILKMAINYYIYQGGERSHVEDAIDKLKLVENDRVELYISRDVFFDTHDGEILHSIFIKGDPESKKLYCIIELFSAVRFLVKLSGDYSGEEFSSLYVYDVVCRGDVQREITWSPCPKDLFNYDYSNGSHDYSIMKESLGRVVRIAQARQKKSFLNRSYDEEVAFFLREQEGKSEQEKQEALRYFSWRLAQKYARLLFRNNPKDKR